MARVMAFALVGSAFAAVLSGCGESSGLFPVYGQVKYKGEPAAGVTLFFHREGGEPSGLPVPTAVSERDGTFVVRTGDLGAGAQAGRYHILLEWRERPPTSRQVASASLTPPSDGGRKAKRATPKIRPTASLPADRLNGSYANIEHPLVKAEIKPGRNDLASIELAN
jgi:hypothetical protein